MQPTSPHDNACRIVNGLRSGVGLAALMACLLALCAAGAAAADDLKRGAQLEKQGRLFRAAEAYSRALRLSPGDQKARKAMQRIADQAIAEKLSVVASLEAELKLDEALAEVEGAVWLEDRLASLQIETERPGAAADGRQQLVTRRVQALLAEAERARPDGLWSVAVAHLQQVLTLQPDNDDTREQLRGAWVAWAETNLNEGRLRAAAERLEQAARVPGAGAGISASRAAAIRIALGMSGFRKGACRSAVVDLRAAERLASGSVAPGVLEEAVACATTCVRLELRAELDSGVSDGQRSSLEAEIRRQVAANASEFLTLKGARAGTRPGCGRRTVPGADGQPRPAGPYAATVTVTSLGVIRQPATSLTRQARMQTGPWADTVVTFEEYQEVLTGTLSGWITVTDDGPGGTSLPLAVRVADEARTRWQGHPVSTSTAWDERSGRRSTGMMVDLSGGKAAAEEARRDARARLIESLVQRFATEAGRLLLTSVDLEPAVPDPTELPAPAAHRLEP
jgi:tetratricopeptide (TPR) repeat protein